MIEETYPIQPEFRKSMEELAHFLEEFLNKGFERRVGFCLLVFEFDGNHRINYISNAERISMASVMAEVALRLRADVRTEN
jgi:hypothetical protein